ncbi:MAG: MFS transporter [PVC group bacterium]|nr:MFS transporter [PVC group bacterium]
MITAKLRRPFLIVSWALYDFANQFFALNVISLYFVRWLTIEKGVPDVYYSITFSISTLFVAVLSPVLGTLSDVMHKHRFFLACFTFLCILFTMFLGFTQNVLLALIFFAIANFGCQQAIIFYNALMLNISEKKKAGLVSGLGKMFGYCGAMVALIFTKPLVLEKGYQSAFVLTGILFFIFALPCILFVKDKPLKEKRQRLKEYMEQNKITAIFKRLKATLWNVQEFKGIHDLFKAAFCGMCVVNMLILFMSVYATKAFGLIESEIIDFIIFSTVFALLGSIISGLISDWLGCKKTLIGVFVLWVICILSGGTCFPPYHWIIGALAGTSLGATWVVSRAFVVQIVPREKLGEVFGIFNFVGYFSCIIGSMLWGVMIWFLSDLGGLGYRITLLSFLPLLVIGIVFLVRIPENNY